MSYIKAKLAVLVPAQIRALRLKSVAPPMPYQRDLAQETGLHQSRISMFETPGAANMTLETVATIAAGLRVGVILKFVPFSEMLRWENEFSPEAFDVLPRLAQDDGFINGDVPAVSGVYNQQISQAFSHPEEVRNDVATFNRVSGGKNVVNEVLADGPKAGVSGVLIA